MRILIKSVKGFTLAEGSKGKGEGKDDKGEGRAAFTSFRLKRGFTLAEVLITLAIIGVLAAIVIPGVIANTQLNEFKTAWKKAYADFSQITKKIAYDNGGTFVGSFDNTHDGFRNLYLPYLNYTKLCNAGTSLGNCWHKNSDWNSFSGVGPPWTDFDVHSRLVTTSGMYVTFYRDTSQCTGSRSNNNDACGALHFDVNGMKGPNVVGKDIFFGYVTKDGLFIPSGAQTSDTFGNTFAACSNTGNIRSGVCCSADYLYK